jgi:hypothetical protein
MNGILLRRTSLVSIAILSAAMARAQIIVSDGPTGSAATPSAIVITDGPSTLPYQYPPKIVTTDGPSTLAYQYPPLVETSNGPAKLFYETSRQPLKVVVSDGPNTSRVLANPETSTLAPAIPVANSVTVLPPVEWTHTTTMAHHASPTQRAYHAVVFNVYTDKRSEGNHFIPSGWMGDYGDIQLDQASVEHPHTGETCIKIAYSAKGSQGSGWAGVYWQTPANNWGDKPGGYDLSGHRRLTFWARGDKGGEVITDFRMGGISGEHGDSDSAATGSIVLSKEWQKYTIGLGHKDLTNIIGGFSWTASRSDNPNGIVFFLDDIRYE